MSVILTDKIQPRTTGIALTVVGDTNVSGALTCTNFTASGDVSIGGTLTYEDVTNIDSVGLITARTGVRVTAGGVVVTAGVSTFTDDVKVNSTLTATEGINVTAGVGTFAGDVSIADKIIHTGDANTAIRFPAADTITAETGGSERLRIDSNGKLLVGGTSTDSSALINIIKDTTEVLADNEPLYNNASPAFLTVYNSNNTGSGEEAGINIVPAGSANGAISIYGKKTGSYAGDLIFRFRSGASTSAERLRVTSGGQLELRKDQDGVTGRPDNRIVFKDTDSSVVAEQPIGEIAWHSTDSGMTNINSYIRGINEATNGSGALTLGVKAAGSSEIEALRITSTGAVGIGTAIPNGDLDIVDDDSSARIYLRSGNSDDASIYFGRMNDSATAAIRNDHSDNSFRFYGYNNSERMRITSDGKILVAHSSSHADMHGKIQVCSNTSHGIDIARQTANAHPPYLNLFKSRNGTVGGNTATLAGDNCGSINGYGNDGSGFHSIGNISFECDEDSANDDIPGRIIFEVTADGGTTLTERLRIDKNGTAWFQKAQVTTQFDSQAFIRCHPTSTTNSGGRSIVFLGTSTAANYGTAMCGYRRGTSGEPTWELRMLNDSVSGTQVEEVRNSGYHAILSTESLLNMNTSQDGSGSDYFARGSKNSTTAGGGNDVFWIYEDGDMYNVNGTFSQSSDIKLKENVVDAPSQWNDLKALKVRKFNFKASTGLDTFTQIGMVAQEVESTCPGLIKERVDLQKTTNSDGTVTETDTGEKTKSIKLTVLYMKAVKALQEAMTRIETLEAKVAALESS